MAIKQVGRDVFGDDGAVRFQGIGVAAAELGGDFEADVEELAEVRIILLAGGDVAQGVDVLLAGPGVDGLGAGKLAVINVDDGGVGLTQGVFVVEGLGIDFFGKGEGVAPGFGEADEFFQPVGAGSFDVESGAGACDGAADGGVDGEFIRAGVDAEFQGGGQMVGLDGVGDDGEVVVEFFFKLRHIADVIDAFVEAASEFRCDGLHGHAGIAEGGEDDQQFGGRLGAIGFIHGDFGDKVIALVHDDVLIDGTGFLRGEQEFVGNARGFFFGDLEGGIDARDGDGADELGVAGEKGADVFRAGGLADVIGDVEREEIAGIEEAIDGVEVDVVGIEQVVIFPAEGGDGLVGCLAGAAGFRADDGVLAVRFVPDWDDVGAELGGLDESCELGFCLVGETIADAEGEFRASFHDVEW